VQLRAQSATSAISAIAEVAWRFKELFYDNAQVALWIKTYEK